MWKGHVFFACAWLVMASSSSGSFSVHGSSTPLVVLNDTNEAVTINAEDAATARDDPFDDKWQWIRQRLTRRQTLAWQ